MANDEWWAVCLPDYLLCSKSAEGDIEPLIEQIQAVCSSQSKATMTGQSLVNGTEIDEGFGVAMRKRRGLVGGN